MSGPQLRAVTIAAADVGSAAAFVATVCGSPVVQRDDQTSVLVDGVAILIEHVDEGVRPGIVSIEIEAETDQRRTVRLNGIDVIVTPTPAPRSAPADVIVDHVAIVVADLDESARHWAATIGAPAELIGIHPASAGTLTAARFTVGDRMVELVSPIPNTDSAIASRLGRVGEGPLALALPAKDLEAKRRQLTEADVKLSWREPHWLVHPANPAGVLIQLTPRVRH